MFRETFSKLRNSIWRLRTKAYERHRNDRLDGRRDRRSRLVRFFNKLVLFLAAVLS